MAEFENGYCTGCGIKARRWGHRPYCWRKVTMMLNVEPLYETKRKLLNEMRKHWRVRSFFLARKEHMYHQPGDLPPWKPVDQRALLREEATRPIETREDV